MLKMMKGLALAAVALATAAALANTASAEPFKLKGDPKPAWIYFNVKNDGGWTQAIDEARLRIEKNLNLQIPFVEKVPEVASEIKAAAERYIKRGHNIIIGSAFGYSDAFKELAAKYPDVAFLNPAGTTNGPNLQSIYGRTYETQYLCGMVAGALTKSKKIGFVAANPFGLVNWTVNAYLLGARQSNPDVTLTVIYTGAWNDPVKERAAAQALVEKGIDVIGQHVDTPTPQVVAQEAGIYGTGHHRDMREFAPKATACSSVWVWDQYMTPTLKAIAGGTWEPAPYGAFVHVGGGTDIACCGDMVPKEVTAKVMAERDAIIKGKQIFTGPIKDQSGKERVAAGKTPSDADLWGMDYLIEGVVGQLN
jgi:basic membrane lipoprotein Med (substrate-binding protein (PBP1-ABC) superfamily)